MTLNTVLKKDVYEAFSMTFNYVPKYENKIFYAYSTCYSYTTCELL